MLWVPLVVGLALAIVALQGKIRNDFPEWGVLISIVFFVVIMTSLLSQLREVVAVFNSMAADANVGAMYLSPVLKTIGVAYLTSFGAHVSRDAGEEAIASIIEFAGKLVIIMVALPVIQAILYALLGILG